MRVVQVPTSIPRSTFQPSMASAAGSRQCRDARPGESCQRHQIRHDLARRAGGRNLPSAVGIEEIHPPGYPLALEGPEVNVLAGRLLVCQRLPTLLGLVLKLLVFLKKGQFPDDGVFGAGDRAWLCAWGLRGPPD